MPKLSELTDAYTPQETLDSLPVESPFTSVPVDADGVRRVRIDAVAPKPYDNLDAAIGPSFGEGVTEHPLVKQLFGLGGETRYQLWPERMVREGLSAAGDVMSGKVPQWAVDPETGDVHTSPNMVEKAQEMSALAGTGGLAGTTDKAAGFSLGVVPVDVAKKLKFKDGIPSDILKSAVDNTPAATIDADGHLVVKMVRHQSHDQELSESVRGGVFYLPEGSPNARHYNGSTNNSYGGQQKIEGETAYKNPLIVKGATGGKAPEAAYNELMGNKKAYAELDKDVMEIVSASSWMRKKDPAAFDELTTRFFEKHNPEMMDYKDYIIDNSSKGNQLRYALSEGAIATAARNAGHDGIIGYSVGRGENKGKPFLSEIFDTRESHYPSPDGDFRVHPELYSDSKVGTGVGAVNASRQPFLRPALKYKDKLYKGKDGQQHLDVIPESIYPEFQKKAMSGEDINEFKFGFVNDKGHFLDRETALKYGIDTGLVDPQAGKFGALTSTLMADSSKPGIAIEAAKHGYELKPVAHNPFEGLDIVKGSFEGNRVPTIDKLVTNKDKFIYHSGTVDDIPNMKYGIEPTNEGNWIKEVAEGSGHDNPKQMLENSTPLSWFSDAPNWVASKVGRKLGKHANEVTDDDIIKHGHLAIVSKKGDHAEHVWKVGDEGLSNGEYSHVVNLKGEKKKAYETDLYNHNDMTGQRMEPFGVERNEYITAQSVEPMFHLKGKDLLDFLKKTGTLKADNEAAMAVQANKPAFFSAVEHNVNAIPQAKMTEAKFPEGYFDKVPQEMRLSKSGTEPSHPGFRWEVYDPQTGKVMRKDIMTKSGATKTKDNLDNKHGGYKYRDRLVKADTFTENESKFLKDNNIDLSSDPSGYTLKPVDFDPFAK